MADSESTVQLQRRAPLAKNGFTSIRDGLQSIGTRMKTKTGYKRELRTTRIPLREVVERFERRRLVDVDEAVE